MGRNTEDVTDRLFNAILQRFQYAQETSNDRASEFIPDNVELLYYQFQRTDIRRAELYRVYMNHTIVAESYNASRLDIKLKSNNKSKK